MKPDQLNRVARLRTQPLVKARYCPPNMTAWEHPLEPVQVPPPPNKKILFSVLFRKPDNAILQMHNIGKKERILLLKQQQKKMES